MSAILESCLVFMLVGSPAQEREAGLLIDSIQQSGGALSRCELRVVLADPLATPGEALRARGATLVPLERDPALEAYPFGRKVLACAQVERTAGARRNLVFFDTDVLVLKPHPELFLSKGEGAALRPVHLVNEVGQSPQAAADAYWAPIHAALGLGARSLPLVRSFVDQQPIRAYYNCGIVSLRSDAGVFREWARVFKSLVADQEYQSRACGDWRHRLFLHQAVLSDVLVARLGASRIRLLPSSYGYPLHLHARVSARLRPKAFEDLHSLIYENVWLDDTDWMALLPAAPELRQRLGEAELSLARVSQRVYRQERSCNTYLVTTRHGSVIIDPAASAATSPLRRLAEAFPPAAVLLTHAHSDHLSGLSEWIGGREIPLVAQRQHGELRSYLERLSGFFARRNAAIDGPRQPSSRPAIPQPSVSFADSHTMEVDGLRLELWHTPGETPDHATIWIPELKAVAVGDNFYESFPNLGTPRGSMSRPALGYVAALDRALSLEPELLLPGHGEPVVGRDSVRRRLSEYRAAILSVHDAVVRGMNEGKDLRTLMDEVSLPPGSGVGEFYGRVSWSVRGIYEGYAGSFGGEVADLYGGAEVAGELTQLAGGPDALARRAEQLVSAGDALRALRLADVALAAQRDHQPAWQARLTALRALRARSRNVIESGLLERAIEAAELQGGSGPAH